MYEAMVFSGLLAIWGDGHRAEPVVECGLRRLAGVLGLTSGGRTATQLRTAIERLKTTTYRTTVSDEDGGRERLFSLLDEIETTWVGPPTTIHRRIRAVFSRIAWEVISEPRILRTVDLSVFRILGPRRELARRLFYLLEAQPGHELGRGVEVVERLVDARLLSSLGTQRPVWKVAQELRVAGSAIATASPRYRRVELVQRQRRPPRPRARLRRSRPHPRRTRRARPEPTRPATHERRAKANLLHDAFVLCGRELASDRAANARAYLEARGIPADRIAESGLGLMPDATRMRFSLASNGYSDTEISASNITSDPRWPGRIVGAWRDTHSRVTTLWARTLAPDADDRYLYLKGPARPYTIPYGLSTILAAGSPTQGRHLLLVEGVIDVHILRARDRQRRSTRRHGNQHSAFRGTGRCRHRERHARTRQRLRRPNRDDKRDPSRHQRLAIIPHLGDRSRPPRGDQGPGDLIRIKGRDAWTRASAAPICGITAHALELTGPVADHDHEAGRRAGLARASAWLGTLHARHAIEQTAALDAVAASLGYDNDAVQRTFRARHWENEPKRPSSVHAIER